MKRTVLIVALILGSWLVACAQTPENSLIAKAKKTFSRAEELHKSNTCEDREAAARLLTDIKRALDSASDESPLDNLEYEKLEARASDQYHAYVRESYQGNCCWAIGIVVQLADDHLEILTPLNKTNLVQIKSYYLQACCNQQGEETASL